MVEQPKYQGLTNADECTGFAFLIKTIASFFRALVQHRQWLGLSCVSLWLH